MIEKEIEDVVFTESPEVEISGEQAATEDAIVMQNIEAAALNLLIHGQNQINEYQKQMQILIHGYVTNKGWNLETHAVDFNIDTGMVTVTPR